MPITTFTVLPSGAFVKLNKTHNIEITDCHGKKSYDILNTTQKKVVVVAEFKENFLLVLSYSRQYQYDIYDLKTGVWQNKVTLPNLEGSLLLFNDRLLVTGLEKKFSVFQLHLDHVENITNQYPAHDRFYYNKLLIFDASHSLIFSHSNGLYDHFVIHMFNANNLQWIKDINFKKINRNIVSLRDVNVAGENLYAVMVSLSEYVEIKYRLYSYHLENHTMKKIKKLRLTEESKLLNMDEDLWVVKYKESLYPTLNYHKVYRYPSGHKKYKEKYQFADDLLFVTTPDHRLAACHVTTEKITFKDNTDYSLKKIKKHIDNAKTNIPEDVVNIILSYSTIFKTPNKKPEPFEEIPKKDWVEGVKKMFRGKSL